MTRQGSFKRAVRQHAHRTGQRYTEARADLEIAERQAFVHVRPFEHQALTAHLEAQYGIRIASLASIDDDPKTRPRGSWPGHYPATLLVKRTDGPPWIARIFSSPADRVSRVDGDAEILRFLATHGFPAERLAHDNPVSVCNGSGVIGRGPRLPALAWLLTTAAEGDLALVEAAMRGYSEHVRLTDDEIDRLPGILDMKPLYVACFQYRSSVRNGRTPTPDDGWPPWDVDRTEHSRRIAARAIATLRS